MLSLNSSYSFANLMDPLLKKSKTHNFCMYHFGWICMCVGQWVVDLVDRQICCKYNNISPQMRLTLRLNLRLVKEVSCLSIMCAFSIKSKVSRQVGQLCYQKGRLDLFLYKMKILQKFAGISNPIVSHIEFIFF